MLEQQTGELLYHHALDVKDRELVRKRRVLEAKIDSLRTEFESAEEELNRIYNEENIKQHALGENRKQMLRKRNEPPQSNRLVPPKTNNKK